ncbi:MAG: hypothetical protein MHM6MM_002743 [Cercozoa sp. M6MM]
MLLSSALSSVFWALWWLLSILLFNRLVMMLVLVPLGAVLVGGLAFYSRKLALDREVTMRRSQVDALRQRGVFLRFSKRKEPGCSRKPEPDVEPVNDELSELESEIVIGELVSNVPREVFVSLWTLGELVIRDFIDNWFVNVSDDDREFADEVRKALDHALCVFAKRAQTVDWTSFVSDHVVPVLTHMMRLYRLTERERHKKISRFAEFSQSEQDKLVLDQILRTHNLHVATKPEARADLNYLRKLCAALTTRILLPKDLHCAATRVLLREVLANSILCPVMGFVTPYWINCGIGGAAASPVKEESKSLENASDAFHAYLLEEQRKEVECPSDERASKIRAFERLKRRVDLQWQMYARTNTRKKTEKPREDDRRKHGKIAEKVAKPDERSDEKIPAQAIDFEDDPPRARIKLASIRFDARKRPHVVYVVDVHHWKYCWTVTKRFSDFEALHKVLKRTMTQLDASLPPKQLLNNLKPELIEFRKQKLQRYLDDLVIRRDVRTCDEFRLFIRPSHLAPEDIGAAEAADGGVLKRILPFRRSASTATNSDHLEDEDIVVTDSEDDVDDTHDSLDSEFEERRFAQYRKLTEPVYQLLNEIFSLEKKGTLRNHAGKLVTSMMEFSLDGWIQRGVESAVSAATDVSAIVSLIDWVRELLWASPTGEWSLVSGQAPSLEEQERARNEAEKAIITMIPAGLARVLGKNYTRNRVLKIFRFLQMEPLVRHIGFVVLDALILEMFPGLDVDESAQAISMGQSMRVPSTLSSTGAK